ncbi:hypothetical protein LguiA_002736 [Lonicera macranthoides]
MLVVLLARQKACCTSSNILSHSTGLSAHLNSKWTPPLEGRFKANFDAAVDLNTGACGVRAVIWDYCGEFYASISKKIGCLGD